MNPRVLAALRDGAAMEDDDDAAEETRRLLGVLDAFHTEAAGDAEAVAAVDDAEGLSALLVARLDAVAGEGAEEKKQLLKLLRYLLDMDDKSLTEHVPKMEEGARILLPSLLSDLGGQTGPDKVHMEDGVAEETNAQASKTSQLQLRPPPSPPAGMHPPQLPVRLRVRVPMTAAAGRDISGDRWRGYLRVAYRHAIDRRDLVLRP